MKFLNIMDETDTDLEERTDEEILLVSRLSSPLPGEGNPMSAYRRTLGQSPLVVPPLARGGYGHQMRVFDDFLSEILTTCVNVVSQLSDFCSPCLITFRTFVIFCPLLHFGGHF